MPVNVSQQMVVFFACVLTGIASCVIGDFLTVTSQKLRFNKGAVFIKDFVFWLIVIGFFFSVIYRLSGAVLRWYVFLGAFFGVVIYILLIRCAVVRIIVKIVDVFLTVLRKILKAVTLPLKKILKLFRPLARYVQNVRKKKDNFVQKNIEKMRRIRILLKKV